MMVAHTTPKKQSPKVPVYRILHAYKKPTPVSLLDKIAVAKSADEVDKLLELGKTYKTASPATRRRWERVASAKKQILAAAPAEEKK